MKADSKQSVPPTTAQRILVGIVLLTLFAVAHYINSNNEKVFTIITWELLYLSLLVFSSIFRKSRVGSHIYSLISLPASIILFFSPLIIGVISIIMTLVTVLSLMLFSTEISKYLFGIHVSLNALTYFLLTTSSIITITFVEKLIRAWNWLLERDSATMNLQNKIALSIASQKRSKFVVFTLYFILLIVFNFCAFNSIRLFDIPNIDNAILQSFATFVAFDRLTSNLSLLKNE